MRRSHPFRFKKAKRKDGFVYLVLYDVDPSRPRSTGTDDYDEAVAWAYANQRSVLDTSKTLKELTLDAFLEVCAFRNRTESHGRSFASSYWTEHRARLVNHIWPRFGSFLPHKVLAKDIDDWLVSLDVAPETRNKILQTVRLVFKDFSFRGLVDRNVARDIPFFHDNQKKRDPITMQEFRILFPCDQDELIRIWGTLKWATYFYIMATTGMRPGEVAAIDLRYWIKGVGYPVSQAIEPHTRIVKGIKTSEKGVKIKPAYFNSRAESLITQLVFAGESRPGLLFPGRDGRGIPSATSNKHFKASCLRADVTLRGRTQYSLRHFYSTTIATHLTEEDAARYLGQTVYRGEYDHRQVVDKLKADEKMRSLSDSLFT